MFRIVFTVLVAVTLTAGYAQAQEAKSSSKLKFGIHLGVGGNGVYGIDAKYAASEDYEYGGAVRPRLGMQLGMVAEYGLTDEITLHSGFIFDGQGFKDGYMKCRLHYVRIPINAQYSLPVGKHSLVFKAGPYLGFVYTGNYQVSIVGDLMDGANYDAYEFHFGNKENWWCFKKYAAIKK